MTTKASSFRSCFLVALSLLFPLLLIEAVHGQYSYTTNNGTITITKYRGTDRELIIPSMIAGLPVTRIGDFAFEGTLLESVSIPSSITEIGGWAFQECNYLTNVSLPLSVTSLGCEAFFRCLRMMSFTAEGITSIEAYTFTECLGLSSVTLGNALTNIGENAFEACGLTNITIPGSVMSIGEHAFRECDRLTNIVFDSGVRSIGDSAFFACIELSSVTIPSSMTWIGDSAFLWCIGLTNVYFKGNAPAIGINPFDGCPATIYYLPGTAGWESTFAYHPTVPWELPYPVILTSNMQSNQFGFIVSWATNADVLIEATTSLTNAAWSHVCAQSLSNGWTYFADLELTNFSSRFYRVLGATSNPEPAVGSSRQ